MPDRSRGAKYSRPVLRWAPNIKEIFGAQPKSGRQIFEPRVTLGAKYYGNIWCPTEVGAPNIRAPCYVGRQILRKYLVPDRSRGAKYSRPVLRWAPNITEYLAPNRSRGAKYYGNIWRPTEVGAPNIRAHFFRWPPSIWRPTESGAPNIRAQPKSGRQICALAPGSNIASIIARPTLCRARIFVLFTGRVLEGVVIFECFNLRTSTYKNV